MRLFNFIFIIANIIPNSFAGGIWSSCPTTSNLDTNNNSNVNSLIPIPGMCMNIENFNLKVCLSVEFR